MKQQRILRILITLSCALVFVTTIGDSAADPALLKSNIVVVKPSYHDNTRRSFAAWSVKLEKMARAVANTKDKRVLGYASALLDLSARYAVYAKSAGHGTGWIWMPADSTRAFVVTNRHVAGQAGSVTLEFANERHPSIGDLPVIYVDSQNDIAIIEVPRRMLPKKATGFSLSTKSLTEGDEVFASGFPGTDTPRGNIPAYSLTNGIISNAEYPGPEGLAIAHTATIDPGNSGGPLLIKAPSTAIGFRVAGMNTWKAITRTNVNISVPNARILEALGKAESARATAKDQRALTTSLKRRAKRLADELGSSRPDMVLLNSMIAYSFVADRPEFMDVLIKKLINLEMSGDEFQRFVSAPVEYTREFVWANLFVAFSTGASNVGAVRLESITDVDRIALGNKVRTVYMIRGERQEVVWVWEHGAWRIGDASLENVWKKAAAAAPPPATVTTKPTPQPRPTPIKAARRESRSSASSLSFRFGFGSSSASGDFSEFDTFSSSSLSIDLIKPISPHLSLVTGIGYGGLGTGYDITTTSGDFFFIEEELGVIQVPAAVQLNLPLVGESATLNLFGRAGLALDVTISTGGEFSGSLGSGRLSSIDWFDKHNFLNIAALIGGGLEIGFGPDPSLFLGFDAIAEKHLLNEWTDGQFSNGGNYKNNASRFGLSLRYRGWR